jgi:hypothetical protein
MLYLSDITFCHVFCISCRVSVITHIYNISNILYIVRYLLEYTNHPTAIYLFFIYTFIICNNNLKNHHRQKLLSQLNIPNKLNNNPNPHPILVFLIALSNHKTNNQLIMIIKKLASKLIIHHQTKIHYFNHPIISASQPPIKL